MGKYLDLAREDGRCGRSGIPPPPTGGAAPAVPAPAFTEERERFLVDYYCSRPRAERLVMYRRGQDLRRLRPHWPGDACDLQAMEDQYALHPADPPFLPAQDGIAFADSKEGAPA